MREASEWSETATADNSAATATHAADARRAHYVTSIHVSFSAAAIKLLTLKQGTTLIGSFYVHNQRDIVFSKPLKFAMGTLVEASLAASGAGGVVGAVVMAGYSVGN